MEITNEQLIDSPLEAIKAAADGARRRSDPTGSADFPEHVVQYATAARELAETVKTLGVTINPNF
jgi:hypothetical protein